MRIFLATMMIGLCILFSLGSACFGIFGVMLVHGDATLNGVLWFVICAALGGAAIACGWAARRFLAQPAVPPARPGQSSKRQ